MARQRKVPSLKLLEVRYLRKCQLVLTCSDQPCKASVQPQLLVPQVSKNHLSSYLSSLLSKASRVLLAMWQEQRFSSGPAFYLVLSDFFLLNQNQSCFRCQAQNFTSRSGLTCLGLTQSYLLRCTHSSDLHLNTLLPQSCKPSPHSR